MYVGRKEIEKKFRYLDEFVVYLTSSLYLIFTVPNLFDSLYAEDGSVYIQNALDNGGFNSLFKTASGYIDIPARVIALIVTAFGISKFALVNGILIVIVMSTISTTIFRVTKRALESRFAAYFISLFSVILPIARYESVGNVTNLHFYMFSASGILIFCYLKSGHLTNWERVFLFLSGVSVPLGAFLFPIFILELVKGLRRIDIKKFRIRLIPRRRFQIVAKNPFSVLFFGLFLNFLFSWGDSTNRVSVYQFNSIEKVSYLFLDRIVGSTFFPFWGRVSTENGQPIVHNSPFSTLVIRAVLASLICVFLVFVISSLSRENRKIAFQIIFSILVYICVLGFIYNLEPRYCIYPSLSLVFILSLFISEHKITLKLVSWLMIWLLSLVSTASADVMSRKDAPKFTDEIMLAKFECAKYPELEEIVIRIAPTYFSDVWNLKLVCSALIRT